MKRSLIGLATVLIATRAAHGAPAIAPEVDGVYAQSEALYFDLHRNPELSSHETRTAEKLAAGLRELGYEVTTGVGGTGVVGVLKNGSGPVVMLRTELDALPVEEKTGLAYASTVRTKDDSGAEVGVMHACGHDIHMASWMGAARIMASTRNQWRGTLVVIGQPAEETVSGAARMLADGLFTRFPRPQYALAAHDDPRIPAGVIGYHAGPILSNVDTLRITIYGAGGHGARPETTVDPIVIAARTVLALQTIVAREISPFDSAVVTVGTLHGGTKNNIIPSEATLGLSVRSLTDPVRARLLKAIERIAKGEAAAAGAPQEPRIERIEGANALINGGSDPGSRPRSGPGYAARDGERGFLRVPRRGRADADAARRHHAASRTRRGAEGGYRGPFAALASVFPGPREGYQGNDHRGSDRAARVAAGEVIATA
jgi:hippurate hydrolase